MKNTIQNKLLKAARSPMLKMQVHKDRKKEMKKRGQFR